MGCARRCCCPQAADRQTFCPLPAALPGEPWSSGLSCLQVEELRPSRPSHHAEADCPVQLPPSSAHLAVSTVSPGAVSSLWAIALGLSTKCMECSLYWSPELGAPWQQELSLVHSVTHSLNKCVIRVRAQGTELCLARDAGQCVFVE